MPTSVIVPGCELQAPAKLNLFLEVHGKRADGYHDLETVMVTLDWHDTLVFTPVQSGELRLDIELAGPGPWPHLSTASDNLIIKAAELLRRETGCPLGARIRLYKRIPMEAGLAGGSSDAAATLKGLNQLWKLGFSLAELRELGACLGSDVPFFLAGSSAAICRGRGEILEPLSLGTRLHWLIVKPDAGLSTALVFRNTRLEGEIQSLSPFLKALETGSFTGLARNFHNRLLTPAMELCPEVARIREVFQKLPVLGHTLSGSGTSYFGLCSGRTQAWHLAGRLRALGLGRIMVAQTCG